MHVFGISCNFKSAKIILFLIFDIKDLPFLELIIKSNHDYMIVLVDGIMSSSQLDFRFGIDFYIHENLS